jgi:putative aldouronate transport system permease protein
MLNEVKKLWYKKFIQTSIYLPHFVSWVVIGSIVIQFLSPSTGPINKLIELLGGEPIFFMVEPKYFRSIVVITNIWKEAGWGTIIYLAAITGIDPTLYEAAIIDGANRWQRSRYITIPSISDTIVILLLLQLGRLLDVGFEQIFVLYNPMVYSVGDVISTYVYRVGLGNGRFSLTTAIGLFQSLVGFVLIITSNYFSKKMFGKSIW